MKIYYPTYYLIPVLPVISFDEDGYSDASDLEENKVNNTYKDKNDDIFKEIDEEYVNESTK